MEKKFSNKDVAQLLRNVSAAYQVKGASSFQIRAYDLAADAVEHASSDVRALWETGDLDKIPGVGSHIANYLDEYFTSGEVRHFKTVFKDIPDSMFELLRVPGIGPKTAYKLAKTGVANTQDLEKQIKSRTLLDKGFGQKVLDNILRGVEEFKRRSDRILLPVAWGVASQVIEYLKKNKNVTNADPLGSLRRKVATVGDIDISVASDDPKSVVEHFLKFPGKERVVEAGERTATISVDGGIRIDLMIQPPERYGSLLQHFTGSKHHNIHIRRIAREKGLSLSEYGIKLVEEKGAQFSQDTFFKCETEQEFYRKLGMGYIEPELREDQGEIEAAMAGKLPDLIRLEDIRGDLHTHSSWSDGQDSIADMTKAASSFEREYIALTDHSYPSLNYEKRLKEIEQYNYSQDNIRVISGLEVNINADYNLQITDDILAKHDIIFVSIHTSFRQSKDEMTQRIVRAMENPHVDALAHPTGRLLLEREGIEADWEKIFKRIGQLGKFLEIDGYPNRLDLPDNLVKEAKRFGVKFTVDTDSHRTEHLKLMEYGVSVARRGWLQKEDVINTLPYPKLKDILGIRD
ncbi:MAG TPA: DNA polymerase/3'-5' exonuclease PolX [Candidatus Nanoarchaeia archaeon]